LYLGVSSLHHLGELEEAVTLADAHAEAIGGDGPLAGACAMLYLDVEQADKAAKLAKIALARNADSVDGLTVEATIAAAELNSGQATRQFSRVTELAPNHGRAWLGLGMLAILAQDFARARELLSRATALMPNHLGSWHALAWAHLFSGDPAGAERNFAHALELDRTFSESHGAMAAMLAIKGDVAAAEREIELAERLDHSGMSSQFARAMLLSRAQGPQAAQQFIRDAIRAMGSRVGGRPGAVLLELAGAGHSRRSKSD
jgi:Flp pilus assembly protein TadD